MRPEQAERAHLSAVALAKAEAGRSSSDRRSNGMNAEARRGLRFLPEAFQTLSDRNQEETLRPGLAKNIADYIRGRLGRWFARAGAHAKLHARLAKSRNLAVV